MWSSYQEAVFEAVCHGSGHLVVRARAGSGKTSAIVESVRRLGERRPRPQILACAFNKRMQEELDARLPAFVKTQTLHSLGLKTVQKYWSVGGPRSNRASRLLTETLGRKPTQDLLRKVLGRAKNELDPREKILERIQTAALPRGVGVSEAYEAVIRALERTLEFDGELDFDDQIYVPVMKNFVPEQYDYVFVDETQDMNLSQLALAVSACKPEGKCIFVGDDRQSIYAWRGSESDFMNRMIAQLGATELNLPISYRCPLKALRLIQAVVPDIEPKPDAIEGELLRASEATWNEGDLVLSRKNGPLIHLALSAIRDGKRARIQGRKSLGDKLRRRIEAFRVLYAYQLISGAEDQASKQEARIRAKASESPTGEMTCEEEADLEETRDWLATLKYLADGLDTVPEILSRIDTLFDIRSGKDDEEDGDESYLTFSNVHQAKGLEWNQVHVLVSTFSPSWSEEEANIWYVALSRTKYMLILNTQEFGNRRKRRELDEIVANALRMIE